MDSREERIIAYLNTHRKFLDDYITGPNVTNEMFHRWSVRRNVKVKKDTVKRSNDPWMVRKGFNF